MQYPGVEDQCGWHEADYTRTTDSEMHDLSGENAPQVTRPTEEPKVKFDSVLAIVEKWCS